MKHKHIRIGTRGSKLALWQANYVASKLLAGGWNTEIVTIETQGDKILDVSIAKIGSKGVFTDEIEERLRSGDIDIAVHSAKDLQSTLPPDMDIIAFTEREKAVDVLVADKKINLNEPLKIGTSSTRRVALLSKNYPHWDTVPVRGNLQTRIRKMKEGACDALMLAFAGVERMGYADMVVHEFPIEEFTPPVGQGIVAVEALKKAHPSIHKALKELVEDGPSMLRANAERAFLKELEGGCSIPAFCHAIIENNSLSLRAGLAKLDGSLILREEAVCDLNEGEKIGKQLAEKILNSGGKEILREIRSTLDK